MINLIDFTFEKEWFYKGEHYSVRDNGSVLRHHSTNGRRRAIDNQWTFGKPNTKSGYLEIASVRVHRIIATAFHGEPPTQEHVVDHIDTNRHNNRPENLRWVTRLENVLLNPITRKRIESVCGCTIYDFLSNPTKYRNKFQDSSFQWMQTVSMQEAKISRERLLRWANNDQPVSDGSLGKWIFADSAPFSEKKEIPELVISLTKLAIQKNWRTPSVFPCCPKELSQNPLDDYFSNLKVGAVFSQNQFLTSIIDHIAISEDKSRLWVVCKNSDDQAIKPYTLAEVTFENETFLHTSLGSFFKVEGVLKQFTLVQDLEWTGGDSIDDYS